MSRATIQPLSVGATAPETLSVLQQRLLVAEEQTEALIQDMASLGVSREQLLDPAASARDTGQRPVSPVQVWRALGGDKGEGLLWRNCEALVSRVCRLESLLQTLKLTNFRLETERELNPSHSTRLTEQLSALQQESEEEQRAARKEVMRVQDQLRQVCQERDEALEEARRLGEALEVTSTSKMDVALAAEDLKMIKVQMSEKLLELKVQLSQEVALRLEMEKSHGALLQRVQEMEKVVEQERGQVRALQTDCHALRSEGQEVRQRLKEEAEKAQRLEEECQQLRDQADVKESVVSQLTDELNSAGLALQRLQQENTKLQKDEETLKAAAEKVQELNGQLQGQCSELSATLRSLTVENARLLTEHQAELKAERERVLQQLQEQDLLLDAARRNIHAELQGALTDRLRLQRELETTRSELAELQQSSMAAQETAATQREILERTVDRLREELYSARQERESMKREKAEMHSMVNKLEGEKSSLETQLSKAKSRVRQLKDELQAVQEVKLSTTLENKCTPTSAELNSWRSRCQKLEEQLRQMEGDYELAVVVRDEAIRNYKALEDHLESLQKEQQKSKLEGDLGARCPDGGWVAQTLQGVLASHSRLQKSTETLQAELGGRDKEIATLREERVQIQENSQRLQTQVEKLQDDCMATNKEMESLRKALETTSLDNKKLAQSLEQALLANSKLLSKLSRTQDQKERSQSLREMELVEAKEEVRWLAEHLDSLKVLLKKERDCGKKVSNKEITELKKALDDASSRSGDLSRSNRELREKVSELEKVVSSQKARIKDMKTQLKVHLESRATLATSQRVKEMEEALKGLESLNDEYQRRNNEQSQLIQQFQSELQRLSSKQEGELEGERELRQMLQDKCQTLEENMQQLKQSRDEAEQRLREASLESQQISENLMEAHTWFRSKFSSLRSELEKSRARREPSTDKRHSLGRSKEVAHIASPEGGKKALCDSGPIVLKQDHWSTALKRWETKRELARISGRCRHTGQTHGQTDAQ
ncbi:coiled-coil domain-containing protein 150 [Megalops cyprinoides]|uniref:coiled-coil domain-containing protein 150 n=1 Tax=Megalops cyprinoides TaxID=118141 RepID=UPI0018652E37|nr:coiled-coil domain-containing protein 150 [Megalops cyprinoides]